MAGKANYRKINDRSQNSSTYHKKDGTPVRAILKRDLRKDVNEKEKDDVEVNSRMPAARPQ